MMPSVMIFRTTESGMECLDWWRDRCNEWCYFRLEDGKMGDQKYLDDWPTRFKGVHVLQHKGAGWHYGTLSDTGSWKSSHTSI